MTLDPYRPINHQSCNRIHSLIDAHHPPFSPPSPKPSALRRCTFQLDTSEVQLSVHPFQSTRPNNAPSWCDNVTLQATKAIFHWLRKNIGLYGVTASSMAWNCPELPCAVTTVILYQRYFEARHRLFSTIRNFKTVQSIGSETIPIFYIGAATSAGIR